MGQLDEKVAMPALKSGDFLWHHLPAIADMAIEQLRKARLKRLASLHIFIISKIMKHKVDWVAVQGCGYCV